MPSLRVPSTASSAADAHRVTSASSQLSSPSHSLSQHASSSAAAAAARPAATGAPDVSSAAAVRTPSGSLLVQPLTQSQLSDLALQMQLPTGLQHAASLVAVGGSTQQQKEGDGTGRGSVDGTAAKQGGKRRRKKSVKDRDPAMAHVEEHLRILKHVHVKHASPRLVTWGQSGSRLVPHSQADMQQPSQFVATISICGKWLQRQSHDMQH